MLEKVQDIVAEQLGVSTDKINEDSKFVEDLGADSLDVVELIMALEEAFNIEIPDDDAEKLTSVKEVLEFIKTKQ